MDKQDGKVYDVDFKRKERDNMGIGSTVQRKNLELDFDYELGTMINQSDKPMSKADFLASQNEGNEMYPYSEVITYDVESERYYNELAESYFQECRSKMEKAEDSERGGR